MMRSMFNADSDSAASYYCLMTYVDNNKMSVYEVSIENTFKIAPDILVLRSSSSVFGFSKSETSIEEIPHAMTP
jgi:hypothetical protein